MSIRHDNLRFDRLWLALRARRAALLLVPVTVAVGLGSRVFLGGLPAKIAGDALYTVLIDVGVVVVRPDVRLAPSASPWV